MPTGYTAAIYEGKDVSFQEFALECARAFGALVLMRDDPPGTPIPDTFEPSTHYEKKLAEERDRLAEIKAWTLSDAKAALEEENARIRAANEDSAARCARLRGDYEEMLMHVRGWKPPSPEHVGLKEFMVEQLEGSIKFDATLYEQPLRTPNPWQYRNEEFEKVEKSIAYYEAEREKEIERAESRSRWVQQLRESLEEGVPA